MRKILAVFVFAVFSLSAYAVTPPPKPGVWKLIGWDGVCSVGLSDYSAAMADAKACVEQVVANEATGAVTASLTSEFCNTTDPVSGDCIDVRLLYDWSSENGFSGFDEQMNLNWVEGEPEPECQPEDFPQFVELAPTGSIPSEACFAGCIYQSRSVGVCVGQGPTASCLSKYELQPNNPCTSQPTLPTTGECVASGDSVYCLGDENAPENCGEVNGMAYCVGDVPDGECTFMGGGSMICASDATNQPTAPDGVTPAAPDATLQDSLGNDFNYYDGQTVADSGTPVTGSPEPDGWDELDDGDGGEGECDPQTEQCEGEGSVSGGQSCDVSPVCDGDPIQCAIVQQTYRTRCPDGFTESELLSATGLQAVGDDPLSTGDPVEIGDFDTSGLGWSRSCLPDQVFVVSGFGEFVLPWSQFCVLFQLIGSLVLMAAAYVSYRLVVGAF